MNKPRNQKEKEKNNSSRLEEAMLWGQGSLAEDSFIIEDFAQDKERE